MKRHSKLIITGVVLTALILTICPSIVLAANPEDMTSQESTESQATIEPTSYGVPSESEEDTVLKGPQYVYKTEYLPHKTVHVSGFIGNQPSGGVKLSPGDGMYYSIGGGPYVTTTVSISIPTKTFMFTVGANIGNRGTCGYTKTLPSGYSTAYYKLRMIKNFDIAPYVVYVKRSGAAYTTWSIDHSGYVVVSGSDSCSTQWVRVG